MNKDYLAFAEPHPELGDVLVIIPTMWAIVVQQAVNSRMGRSMSDEDALDEFMVIHWASYYTKQVEAKEGK